MRLFALARRPPQWLRVALAGLLLGFALNSVAHVSHRHEATSTSASHSVTCNHCVSFGTLAGAPSHSHPPGLSQPIWLGVTATQVVLPAQRLRSSAHPRAPPLS
jgi:hypothetical protein